MSDNPLNRPSTASLLPPDIIFIITLMVFPDPKIKRHPRYRDDRDSFVKLTRVCRGWRNALLSYPIFWTNIEAPLQNLWFLEQVLLRSADYPIQVNIKIGVKQAVLDQIMEIIRSHLHRIQHLVFHHETNGYTPDVSCIFRAFENQAVPALRVFGFDLQSEQPWWSDNRGTIPKNFLVDIAPNLEELQIASMTISPQMPIFKTVTRLNLSFIRGITSFHQLFDVLEATSPSHLEILELSRFMEDMPRDFEVQDLNDRSIQFPRLKRLSLSLEPEILMAVLDHTTFPSEIDWVIDCHDVLSKSSVNINPLLSFVSKTRNGTCLTIKADYANLQIDFSQEPSGPYNTCIKMEMSIIELCKHRLNSMFINFGFSKVYFCDILFPSRSRGIPPWLDKYENSFDTLLSLLTHLEKLVIACEDATTLTQIISELIPEEGSTTVPCPLLSDLKVGAVSTTGKSLAQILAHRKKAGSVLTNLCVEYSHTRSYRGMKPVFEEFVENVEVAFLCLVVEDNLNFMKVSGGRMYDVPMNSYSTLSYTDRDPNVSMTIQLVFGIPHSP